MTLGWLLKPRTHARGAPAHSRARSAWSTWRALGRALGHLGTRARWPARWFCAAAARASAAGAQACTRRLAGVLARRPGPAGWHAPRPDQRQRACRRAGPRPRSGGRPGQPARWRACQRHLVHPPGPRQPAGKHAGQRQRYGSRADQASVSLSSLSLPKPVIMFDSLESILSFTASCLPFFARIFASTIIKRSRRTYEHIVKLDFFLLRYPIVCRFLVNIGPR